MLAGGQLRYHAAIDGMHLNLGGHAARQHRPTVLDNGGGGVVTGGFNGKNIHRINTYFLIEGTSGHRCEGSARWRLRETQGLPGIEMTM